MPTNEIDGLIIRHLADVEAAVKRIGYAIQPQVNAAMNKAVEEWAKSKGWSSGGDFDEGSLWLSPSDWELNSEEDEWISSFYVYAGEQKSPGTDGWEDEYWLSQLCGVGDGAVGIRWKQLKVSKSPWKKFLAEHIKMRDEAPFARLRQLGFHYEEKLASFFLPFQIDPAVLAKAVEEDAVEEALQPLREALDGLDPAKAEFDRMLTDARRQFGG